MLADRVMRGEEGSEFEARHWFLSGLIAFVGWSPTYGARSAKSILDGRQSCKGAAADVHAAMGGPKPAALGWSQKKPQSGSTNAARFGGHVMVHCTDSAGSVGCSIGQPGHDRMRRHAPSDALSENHYLPRSSADCVFGRKRRRPPFLKAAPSVHPIDAAILFPVSFGPIRFGGPDP
jgi:hypothetical protein